MNHQFSEEQSSDVISFGSRKQTHLSRFLRTITPSLLSDMKKYLHRQKFLQEVKDHDPHKISLYEDIYAIVTLKQKEEEIFNEKGKLKQTIQDICAHTKRKYITIDERLKKKIYQLTPDQLRFFIQNSKDIVFRGNSKILNTDEWPQHLKNQVKNGSSDIDEPNAINVDSQSESRISMTSNVSQRKPLKIKPQKKVIKQPSVIQNIVQIMTEPDGREDAYWPQKQDLSFRLNELEIGKDIDLKNPIERGILAQKVLDNWKSQNLQTYLQNDQRLMLQSKICYNFKTREYIFVNPALIKKVFAELKKEETNQLKNKEILQKKQKRLIEEKNKLERMQEEKIYGKRNSMQSIEQQEDQMKTTVRKTRLGNQKYYEHSPVIQISDSFQENQINQINSKHDQVNVENLIQFLQDFSKNQDLSKLPEEARQLLENGLKMKDQAKSCIQAQKQQTKKLNERKQMSNILTILSDEQQKLVSSQNSNESSKKMIYWFNNDKQLYEEYQQNPYQNGYLMWSDEEDEVLQRVNSNFNKYSGDFQKLVKAKSAEMVKKRINFLKIQLKPSLEYYMKNILKH